MFFATSTSLLSLVVLSSISLSQAADNATSSIPQCAAKCMHVKLDDAAKWFGQSEVQTYCQHPEFLDAYNRCLHDNCPPGDLQAGILAGQKTCEGVTPQTGNASTSPDSPKNITTHPPLSGPAGTPDNSTLLPSKNGTNLGGAVNTPNGALISPNNATTNTNGALPTTTTPTSNTTGSNSTATNRFSGAVSSAAANASSQAGAASATLTPTAVVFTAFSSCLLSLLV